MFIKLKFLFFFIMLTGVQFTFAQSFLSTLKESSNFDVSVDQIFSGSRNFAREDNQKLIELEQGYYLFSELHTVITGSAYGIDYDSLFFILQLAAKQEFRLALLAWEKITPPIEPNLDELYELYLSLGVELNFAVKNYARALKLSSSYLDQIRSSRNFGNILYANFYSLYQLNKEIENLELVDMDTFKNLSPLKKENLKIVLLENAVKNKRYGQILKYYAFNGNKFSTLEKINIQSYIDKVQDLQLLDELKEVYRNLEIQQFFDLRKIELLMLNNKLDEAEQNLYLSLEQSDNYTNANQIKLRNLETKIFRLRKVKPKKIGILLPLSAENPQFQLIVRNAIEGINLFFQHLKSKGQFYELIFEDTALKPEIAVTAFRKLVEQENVVVVIGPITRLNSEAIANIADEYVTPVISFTKKEEIETNSHFLYRYQRDITEEIRSIVSFAIDYLGVKKFIAFYIEDEKSDETRYKTRIFAKEVVESNAEILEIKSIKADQVDFRKVFRDITGVYRYLNSQERIYYASLRDKEHIPPAFDAFYFPFSAEKIHSIASFFEAYNLENVYILAGSSVNSPQLPLISTKNLYFADIGYFYENSLANEFISAYNKFNRYTDLYKSPSIYTILFYDSLELVSSLIEANALSNGIELKQKLDFLNSYPILSGFLSIDKNGKINKSLNVYSVEEYNITPYFYKN